VIVVAHSAGVLVTVHWAATTSRTSVVGALLATPPAFAAELPPEYPSLRQLRDHGWLPVPRRPLPFPSILATSTDDALGNPVRLRAMANAWGSREHSLGAVGHLNGASGYGDWPEAVELIRELEDAALRPLQAVSA
jgi:predicted alpha/beta hydrolase family esterase